MAKPAFSDREFEITGMYPGIERFEVSNCETSMPETPIYNRPISVRDNWRLLLSGKKPYWIPTSGWFMCEQNQFRPRLCPDNIANHQVFDGGPTYEYERLGKVVHSAWFGLDWEWEPAVSGATVRPGNPVIKDINHWEDYVSIPDLNKIDWTQYVEENRRYLDIDKMNELGIQFGLWERLMCLMDVDKAAVALVDDDQKGGVHRFLDRLCDFYDDYIGRIAELYNIDGIYLHDDWAHQNGPFFSAATAREMLLPYMKRVAESAHKRGLYFEHHCCGKAELLVPVMIEAGVDIWCGQFINDLDALAHKYSEYPIVFGVGGPRVPLDSTDGELRSLAYDWVERYKGCRVASMFAFDPDFGHPAFAKFTDYVYEYSRKAFSELD